MKSIEKKAEKRIYLNPEIVNIELDNEISLALESNPPGGPGETGSLSPEYLKSEPYNNQLG